MEVDLRFPPSYAIEDWFTEIAVAISHGGRAEPGEGGGGYCSGKWEGCENGT